MAKLLLPPFIVIDFETAGGLLHKSFKLRTIRAAQWPFEIGLGKALNLVLIEIAETVEPSFQVIDHVGVGHRLERGRLVEWFERRLDILDGVLKIEDKCSILSGAGSVQAR